MFVFSMLALPSTRSVVFNYRGCGNTKVLVSKSELFLNIGDYTIWLQTPRLYSLVDVSDLTEVVEHIHSTYSSSTIVAIGVSMGR